MVKITVMQIVTVISDFCDIALDSFYREALTFYLLKVRSVRASG